MAGLKGLPLGAAIFVAVVWLNQGVSLADWKARSDAGVLDRLTAPFAFLYRRALDEEIYFASASAILGAPYDTGVFAIRGPTPLPPIATPADGRLHVPYAEVPFEYPPPNLPFVVAPRLVAATFEGYSRVFGAIMGALLVLAALLGLRASGGTERRARLLGFAALLLAHGAIAIQRLDAIVALLLMLVVTAAIARRERALGFWAGLACATKLVPIVVAAAVVVAGGPLARRRLAKIAQGTAGGLALGLGPMLLLDGGAIATMFRYHGARGLHVESSLGVLYGAVRTVIDPVAATLDYGSFNFHGGVADVLAKATPILLAVLVGLVVHAARPAAREGARERRIVLAALAATMALWLGSKVFSPQYLTWALPLAIALPAAPVEERLLDWKRVALGLGVVLLLTQLYYRGYYDHVYNQRPLGVLTMVVRLVLLAGVFAVVVRSLRFERAQPSPQ